MLETDRDRAALRDLPTLPVFLKLRGRRVVLAGGGEPAVWKAEVLCAAGALVEAYAAVPCAGLEELAAAVGPDALRLVRRPWQATDLEGAAIALGAIEDDAEAGAFRAAAVAARVPVNVVDKPALCDFQFGTLVDRSPLLLAITTDGAAPVFGQAIRSRIEALLPGELRSWAAAAKSWRADVQALGWSFRQRRRFWEVFADGALRSPGRAPDRADFQACLTAAQSIEASSPASVTLVGCGPGTLDDVTLGAVRALQAADAILYDRDVGPDIVNLGRREAAKRPVDAQREADHVADAAGPGRRVVWLGMGDAGRCRRWDVRANLLARHPISVTRLAGVGRCALCGDACPDGAPIKSSPAEGEAAAPASP